MLVCTVLYLSSISGFQFKVPKIMGNIFKIILQLLQIFLIPGNLNITHPTSSLTFNKLLTFAAVLLGLVESEFLGCVCAGLGKKKFRQYTCPIGGVIQPVLQKLQRALES